MGRQIQNIRASPRSLLPSRDIVLGKISEKRKNKKARVRKNMLPEKF